mgnify:CR=1 FL=1
MWCTMDVTSILVIQTLGVGIPSVRSYIDGKVPPTDTEELFRVGIGIGMGIAGWGANDIFHSLGEILHLNWCMHACLNIR